ADRGQRRGRRTGHPGEGGGAEGAGHGQRAGRQDRAGQVVLRRQRGGGEGDRAGQREGGPAQRRLGDQLGGPAAGGEVQPGRDADQYPGDGEAGERERGGARPAQAHQGGVGAEQGGRADAKPGGPLGRRGEPGQAHGHRN